MLVEIESENFQDNWLDVISYQIVLSIKDGLACYFRMDLPFTRAQKCVTSRAGVKYRWLLFN